MDEPLTKKGAAQLLQDTFDMVGGVTAFAQWAQENPDKFYPIWSKLVPASLQVKETRDIQVTVSWLRPDRLAYKNQNQGQGQGQEVVDVVPVYHAHQVTH